MLGPERLTSQGPRRAGALPCHRLPAVRLARRDEAAMGSPDASEAMVEHPELYKGGQPQIETPRCSTGGLRRTRAVVRGRDGGRRTDRGRHSLKDKRQVVKSSSKRRGGGSGSPAEVGAQDVWQRAQLGFAVVSSSAGQAEHVLDDVERFGALVAAGDRGDQRRAGVAGLTPPRAERYSYAGAMPAGRSGRATPVPRQLRLRAGPDRHHLRHRRTLTAAVGRDDRARRADRRGDSEPLHVSHAATDSCGSWPSWRWSFPGSQRSPICPPTTTPPAVPLRL